MQDSVYFAPVEAPLMYFLQLLVNRLFDFRHIRFFDSVKTNGENSYFTTTIKPGIWTPIRAQPGFYECLIQR